MARFSSSRWPRCIVGVAIFAIGVAVFVARPGIALAHHVTITDQASCDGWSTRADYVGGDGDRLIVVDVTINGEHISQSLYFDLAPGHLGHVDNYVLYVRTGTGSLQTSGSVKMYDKVNGNYTQLVDSDFTSINLVCATATPTATNTATPVPPTNTPTATATATVEEQGTSTPLPTNTPHPTNTPEPTSTATFTTTDGTITPIPTNTATATNTPQTTDTPQPKTHTPVATDTPASDVTPASTPTLTSSVRGAVPPGQPTGDSSPRLPTGRAFPATGEGIPQRGGIAIGLLGTLIAAAGLVVFSTGLCSREI